MKLVMATEEQETSEENNECRSIINWTRPKRMLFVLESLQELVSVALPKRLKIMQSNFFE